MLEEMEKVVMWYSLCHVSKLGCVYMKLYRYYFSHSNCVLHQLKDVLGTDVYSDLRSLHTVGLCQSWGRGRSPTGASGRCG